jgi:hypothetical protein
MSACFSSRGFQAYRADQNTNAPNICTLDLARLLIVQLSFSISNSTVAYPNRLLVSLEQLSHVM